MKIAYLMIPVLMLLLTSCSNIKDDNHDYPKKVLFPAEGGTKIFYGNTWITRFYIFDKKDPVLFGKTKYSEEVGDSLVASHSWMEVRQKKYDNGLTIIAAPNTSKEPRRLEIEFLPGFLEIGSTSVMQEGIKE